MNVGSLFSGIGGIELGFHRHGFQTKWFVERQPYAAAVLKKRFPGIPVFGEIADIDFGALPKVDVLVGGFPCQDASIAKKNGRGISGPKTGQWRYFKEAIRTIRPKFALLENVPNLLKRGFEQVLADLAEIGYDAQWQVVSAGCLGYPHRRERLFVLAYPAGFRRLEKVQSKPATKPYLKHVTISQTTMEAWCDQLLGSPLLGADDGFPTRVDETRCLGNAVIPDVAELFAKEILRLVEEGGSPPSSTYLGKYGGVYTCTMARELLSES